MLGQKVLMLKDKQSIDSDTPAGIVCVLRLQTQAMPAARELVNKKYEHKSSSKKFLIEIILLLFFFQYRFDFNLQLVFYFNLYYG